MYTNFAIGCSSPMPVGQCRRPMGDDTTTTSGYGTDRQMRSPNFCRLFAGTDWRGTGYGHPGSCPRLAGESPRFVTPADAERGTESGDAAAIPVSHDLPATRGGERWKISTVR